jgi:hypothetical protein
MAFGRFTIDNDEQLREMTFPKYLLECCDVTPWAKSSLAERRTIKHEGWQRIRRMNWWERW